MPVPVGQQLAIIVNLIIPKCHPCGGRGLVFLSFLRMQESH